MTRLTVTLAAMALLVLVSCVTPISPEQLKKPTGVSPITIQSDFTYPLSTGSNNKLGLRAGSYIPEYEDNSGIFYRGPAKCVINQINIKPPNVAIYEEGGLWIPKASQAATPRIYHYLGTLQHQSVDPMMAEEQAR